MEQILNKYGTGMEQVWNKYRWLVYLPGRALIQREILGLVPRR